MTAAVQEDLAGLEELLLGDVLCEFDVFEPDGYEAEEMADPEEFSVKVVA